MTTYPKTADALRQRIERDLGPIAERHWQIAERRGQVDDVLVEPAGADRDDAEKALRELVQDLRAAAQEPAARPASERTVQALGFFPAFAAAVRIAAFEVASHPAVVAFRRKHLPAGLLDPGEVQDLVLHWQREQGPETFVVSLEIEQPEAAQALRALDSAQEVSVRGAVCSFATVRISIATREHGLIRSIPVARTGPLADLRAVVHELANYFNWYEGEIAGYVLTGHLPRLSPAAARGDSKAGPSSRLVRIETNPFVPAKVVSDLYEQVRAQYGQRKAIGATAAQRAVFVVERNDGRPWPEVFAEWRRRHPRTGGDWRAFRRSATRAYQQLTGRDLHWNGRRGRPRKGRGTLPARPAH